MDRTEDRRFGILLSILRRHDRACKATGRIGVDHDLSNVRQEGTEIVVTTKTAEQIRVSGSVIVAGGARIPIDRINEIKWIVRDPDTFTPRMKKEHFDRLYLKYDGTWVKLDGLGQSVFPIMKFIKWAKEHGWSPGMS